jgi:hypothetical protein
MNQNKMPRAPTSTHASVQTEAMQEYFSGERLWGDDMSPTEILEWYRDEENSYLNMQESSRVAYVYSYHALNQLHGYRHLPDDAFTSVMSLGGAYAEELRPIASRTGRIVIVESAAYSITELCGTPVEYRKSQPSGTIPAANAEFELITCLGALHHIPNVSTVIRELCRVLAPNGWMLLREPIVSMGDWRQPRQGLTRRERGIPHAYLRATLEEAGLTVLRAHFCVFPLTVRLGRLVDVQTFNSSLLTRLDAMLSSLIPWQPNYHPTAWWQRIQPSSAFYVLTKQQ